MLRFQIKLFFILPGQVCNALSVNLFWYSVTTWLFQWWNPEQFFIILCTLHNLYELKPNLKHKTNSGINRHQQFWVFNYFKHLKNYKLGISKWSLTTVQMQYGGDESITWLRQWRTLHKLRWTTLRKKVIKWRYTTRLPIFATWPYYRILHKI